MLIGITQLERERFTAAKRSMTRSARFKNTTKSDAGKWIRFLGSEARDCRILSDPGIGMTSIQSRRYGQPAAVLLYGTRAATLI